MTDQPDMITGNYGVYLKVCQACHKVALFVQQFDDAGDESHDLVYPVHSEAPDPNDDLPGNAKEIYEEARAVHPHSARASAALLRLGLQMICIQQGLPGRRIDDDIQALIDTKGLRPTITTAMDIVRITGNEAVHPGTIDLNDDANLTLAMFRLINMIATDLYTHPRELSELLGKLPDGPVKAIDDRAVKAAAKTAKTTST